MKLALIFGLFVAIANCITIANYTFDATNGQWNSSRLPESIGKKKKNKRLKKRNQKGKKKIYVFG